MWQQLLIVGLGGAIGAITRFGMHAFSQRSFQTFPFGTLTVNVIGCLIIGAMMAVIEGRPTVSPNVRLFVIVGLLGSFTTFSTFGFETFELLRQKEHLFALLSVAGNLLLGVGAVVVGRGVVKAVV